METIFSGTAVLSSIVALVFLALQTRTLARQSALLAEQTALVAEQSRVSSTTAELTFNLAVMQRLDVVLLEIADRPRVHSAIWRKKLPRRGGRNNDVTHVLTQALVDVLDIALTAAERLPSFSVNKTDWERYAAYVAGPDGQSALVRHEILTQPDWWPNACAFLQSLDAAQQVTGQTL